MHRTGVFLLCAALLLCSCGAPTAVPTDRPTQVPTPLPTATPVPTETPIPTETPLPTETPIPLADLEGSFFFDYNGSGLREEGEPPVAGFTVCASAGEKPCVQTDASGRFVFPALAPQGKYVLLTLVDPNADDPALAFRYTNVWKQAVDIPAHEINGVQVPAQHLNETESLPFGRGLGVTVGESHAVGLMQGPITYPFTAEGFTQFRHIEGFDHNPTADVMDYTGERTRCWNQNCPGKPADSVSPISGLGNNHSGIDYGYFGTPQGPLFLAAHNGYIEIYEGPPLTVILRSDRSFSFSNPGTAFVTLYGHADAVVVDTGDYVRRGQILGLIGVSGTNWPHVHFEIQYGEPIEFGEFARHYSKDFYAMTVPEFVVPGFNDLSSWTVWNSPRFALTDF